MRLNKLSIHRETYGPSMGKLYGKIEFEGPHGKIEIPLDEVLSQEIVRLCADGITRMSRDVAENLTADVIDGHVALPASGED